MVTNFWRMLQTLQTFPKYGPYDFYLVNLSLLGAILAIFQFCGFSGLFWPFSPCTLSSMRQTSPTSILLNSLLNFPREDRFLVIKVLKVSLKSSILSCIMVALLVRGEGCMLNIRCVSSSLEHEVCLRSKSVHVRYAGQRMFFSSIVDSAVSRRGL